MSVALNPGQARAWREVLLSGARNCLLYGGSRSGKTFVLCLAIHQRALVAPGSRHAILRRHAVAARASIARDTYPAMIRAAASGVSPAWNETRGVFSYPNGSEVYVQGLDDQSAMEKVLGREFSTIYENEASEIPYSGHILLRSRLAQVAHTSEGPLSQRIYCDLNPTTRSHWTYRLWIDHVDPESQQPVDPDAYAWGTISPRENAANLSPDYLRDLETLPAAARRRFLDGEYQGDAPGALWTRDRIVRVARRPDGALSTRLTRIVVAVDPAASSRTGSDETGIVAAGLGQDGRGYVLDDQSGRWAPDEWARRVVATWRALGADRIVAEANQGGEMVAQVIRAHEPAAPVKLVHATRGKVVRAEPVAALYELGRVYHVGEFPELEDQMCSVTSAFDPRTAGWSPDRVDALVWAFTDLFPALAAPAPPADPRAAVRAPIATGWMR